jgi:hypothetical protein
MATKLGNRISRAVTNAIQARDRAEMRAMDAVLSLVESPTSSPSKTRGQKAPRGPTVHRRGERRHARSR